MSKWVCTVIWKSLPLWISVRQDQDGNEIWKRLPPCSRKCFPGEMAPKPGLRQWMSKLLDDAELEFPSLGSGLSRMRKEWSWKESRSCQRFQHWLCSRYARAVPENQQRAHSASTLRRAPRGWQDHTHILGTRWSQLNPKRDLIALCLLVLLSIPGNTLFRIDAGCIPNHGRSSPGPGGRREGQARTLLLHSQVHLSGGALWQEQLHASSHLCVILTRRMMEADTRWVL